MTTLCHLMPPYSILLLGNSFTKVVNRGKQQHVGKQRLNRVSTDESLLMVILISVAQVFKIGCFICVCVRDDLFSHVVLAQCYARTVPNVQWSACAPDVPDDVPECPRPQTLSQYQTHLGRASHMQSSAELWELYVDEAIFLRRSRGGLRDKITNKRIKCTVKYWVIF